MRLARRIVVALLIALTAAALAVFHFSEKSAPPGGTELERLAVGFMECLPETTTTAKREEIRGILDRFCSKAISGGIHAEDVIAIENDLRAYVSAGEIPDSSVFAFMSKVGNATRRLK